MSFDQIVFGAIHDLAGRYGVLDFAGIFLARYLPYFLSVAFFIILFLERRWKRRFRIFALAALSIILARGLFIELIRLAYFRPRPDLALAFDALIPTPASSSFPSGHAAVFFALGVALWFLNRRAGIVFASGAALVAVARVFVGVHWPSDVFAGALLGAVSAYIINRILTKKEVAGV